MMQMNFLVFLSLMEITFILLVIVIVQALFIRKYRPYYLANTQPHHFLRKYIQRLIGQTREFAADFEKPAENGDLSAYRTRQNMTARLNWLILERDFATTTDPDIRYWEHINKRIREMLKKWKEIEIIKEPPDIEVIKLALDGAKGSGTNSSNASGGSSEEDKQKIADLKKKVLAMSGYESMYNEMDVAYQTLESTYEDLKSSLKDLELEAGEAEKLRDLLKQQEAQEASLDAMMSEMEATKERLSQELEQLEQAYGALEEEVTQTDALGSGDYPNALSRSENPDAQEIVAILTEQEQLLSGLKDSIETLKISSGEKEEVNKFTGKIEQSNKDISHSMQMLELERERLVEEVNQLQNEDDSLISESEPEENASEASSGMSSILDSDINSEFDK